MKIFYSFLFITLFSKYAFASDDSKKLISRSTAVLGSGYYYPSQPDSEEKMLLQEIMRQKCLHNPDFRADSPYPEKILVLQQDIAVLQSKESSLPSLKIRKESEVSYGSLSTISTQTPISVQTPTVAQGEEPIK